MFNLPSKRTLGKLLEKLPVKAGINKFLMVNFKKSVTRLKKHEKMCMLMFDEISLMPQVNYIKQCK